MPHESGNETKFSLMSFNIAHGRGLSLYQGFHSSNSIRKNLEKIAALIKSHAPDIVAFQEIDQSSHWNKHIDLLKHIQDETGYQYSEHGIHNTRFGRKSLRYGNAFLSKHPILKCQVFPFGERTVGEKGFMEARIQVGDRQIDIINLHLDFRSRRMRISQTESIVERIKGFVAKDGANPPIICGDFNTGSKAFSDAVRQFLIRSAQHVKYTYHPQNERTFPAHFPYKGLDFVLAPEPYSVCHARAIKSFASDHLPVLVDFRLTSAKKKPETYASSFL